MKILLQVTNTILSQSALLVNESVQLSSQSKQKSAKIPLYIRKSNASLVKLANRVRTQSHDPRLSTSVVENSKSKYKQKKAQHRRLVRTRRLYESNRRDQEIFSIFSNSSNTVFRKIRKVKKSSNVDVKKLHVRDKVYEGNNVCDGFYDSIAFLKTEAHHSLESSPSFISAKKEYENILRICKLGAKIPKISFEQTTKILESIRPSVSDYASITAYHYLHSGPAGILHLHELLNAPIDDVNNMSIDELNIVSACVLHKGHNKEKNQADSYRTISSCPLLSKAIDTYIGELYDDILDEHQASTQFQGKGSNHELAALLLTETIQHSLHTSKKPLFVLYLDARSAFDLVLRQFLINNLFDYGIQGHGLLLIDQRIKNRKTICEWNGQVMGPIHDKWGLEQGGKKSSDFYKVYNNCQLETAQDSELGVDLGGPEPLIVSSIGQADDVGLVSNDIFALQSLLELSLQYCKKHHVTLRPDKTKLQVFCNKNTDMLAYYAQVVAPINIDGEKIKFDDEAEHVGLLRSVHGNLAHILNRFTAHRRSLAAVLPVGLARGHRGNPAASLRIHQMYSTPVLFSGLSSLVLNPTEVEMIDMYLKVAVQNLQKLMDKTPACVVAFLGGALPGTALLHMRQLNLFGMVTRLPGSILNTHGTRVLISAKPSPSSWFQQIQDLCLLY